MKHPLASIKLYVLMSLKFNLDLLLEELEPDPQGFASRCILSNL